MLRKIQYCLCNLYFPTSSNGIEIVWTIFYNSLTFVGILIPVGYESILCIQGIMPDKVVSKFKKNATTNNGTLSCRFNCD